MNQPGSFAWAFDKLRDKYRVTHDGLNGDYLLMDPVHGLYRYTDTKPQLGKPYVLQRSDIVCNKWMAFKN